MDGKITEETEIKPVSTEGMRKYSGEMYIKLWNQNNNMQVSILRFSNVYGPGSFTKESMPFNIYNSNKTSIDKGYVIKEIESGDYIYSDDAAEAVVLLLERNINGVFNIVKGTIDTEFKVSVKNAKKINSIKGYKNNEIDPKKNVYSNEKAFIELGWKPVIDISDGIFKSLNYTAIYNGKIVIKK